MEVKNKDRIYLSDNKEVIFFNDDDSSIRMLMEEVFKKFFPEYSFNSFKSCDYLSEALESPPDNLKLVLTDHDTPGKLNGLDILKKYCESGQIKVPFIMMSGNLGELERKALEAGAVKFIPKPFGVLNLVGEIKEYLKK